MSLKREQSEETLNICFIPTKKGLFLFLFFFSLNYQLLIFKSFIVASHLGEIKDFDELFRLLEKASKFGNLFFKFHEINCFIKFYNHLSILESFAQYLK